MNYELAKKLKEAGMEWKPKPYTWSTICDCTRFKDDGNTAGYGGKTGFQYHTSLLCESNRPTLSELIEACVMLDYKFSLYQGDNQDWMAAIVYKESPARLFTNGLTPEEAVANLWLKLNEV